MSSLGITELKARLSLLHLASAEEQLSGGCKDLCKVSHSRIRIFTLYGHKWEFVNQILTLNGAH